MRELTYTGVEPTLYRGCRYIFPGEVIPMKDEEATYRLKHQGYWIESKDSVNETPIQKEVPTSKKEKEKILPKKDDKIIK